ncbi:amino acid permease [Microbacterium koreense]|uniref:Amino acid permease n=1 Tax=Microbacterium koreense TaxID=323761 RepID=A0ABW2ZVC8_9MICO
MSTQAPVGAPTQPTPHHTDPRHHPGAAKAIASNKGTLTIFGFAMLNIAAVAGIAGAPQQAEYGLASVTYYIIAAVLFLAPISLIAAELATGWPERGGIFRWVGEAFGKRWGFVAIFLLFLELTLLQPGGLASGAVVLGFLWPDYTSALSWAEHTPLVAVLLYILVYFWLATFLASRGVKVFAAIAKWGVVFGMFVPLGIMFVLAIVWLAQGNTPAIELEWSGLIPEWSGFSTLALAAGIFLAYAGMEMNAAHVKELKNPGRQYPLAILIGGLGTVVLFVVSAVIVAIVVPQKDINVIYSLYTVFQDLGASIGMPWLFTVVAWLTIIAGITGVVTWLAGPSSMLVAAGRGGFLPVYFQHLNSKGMPSRIMYGQAIVVTVVSFIVALFPSIQAFFVMMSATVNMLYLTVYLLMFAAFIRLRYTQPNRPRTYRVPGGNAGAWIIGGVGFLMSAFGYVLAVLPPTQIDVGSPLVYSGTIAALLVICYLLSFWIYSRRKPKWVDPSNDTAPFTWEIEGQDKPTHSPSAVPTAVISDGQAGMGLPIRRQIPPTATLAEAQAIQPSAPVHEAPTPAAEPMAATESPATTAPTAAAPATTAAPSASATDSEPTDPAPTTRAEAAAQAAAKAAEADAAAAQAEAAAAKAESELAQEAAAEAEGETKPATDDGKADKA